MPCTALTTTDVYVCVKTARRSQTPLSQRMSAVGGMVQERDVEESCRFKRGQNSFAHHFLKTNSISLKPDLPVIPPHFSSSLLTNSAAVVVVLYSSTRVDKQPLASLIAAQSLARRVCCGASLAQGRRNKFEWRTSCIVARAANKRSLHVNVVGTIGCM